MDEHGAARRGDARDHLDTSRIAGEAPTICGARQPGRTAGRSPAGPGLARDSCLSNCSLAAPESTS